LSYAPCEGPEITVTVTTGPPPPPVEFPAWLAIIGVGIIGGVVAVAAYKAGQKAGVK